MMILQLVSKASHLREKGVLSLAQIIGRVRPYTPFRFRKEEGKTADALLRSRRLFGPADAMIECLYDGYGSRADDNPCRPARPQYLR